MRIWYNDAFKAGYEKGFAKAKKLLDDIDTITVVRCKNCKHWYSDADTGMACEFTNMGQPEDGFCNWAERRSDETD